MPYTVHDPQITPTATANEQVRRNKRPRISPDPQDDAPAHAAARQPVPPPAASRATAAHLRPHLKAPKSEPYVLRTVPPPMYAPTPQFTDDQLRKIAIYISQLDAAAGTQEIPGQQRGAKLETDAALLAPPPCAHPEPAMPPTRSAQPHQAQSVPSPLTAHQPPELSSEDAHADMDVDPLPSLPFPPPPLHISPPLRPLDVTMGPGVWANGVGIAPIYGKSLGTTVRRAKRNPPMANFISGDDRADDLRASNMLFVTPPPRRRASRSDTSATPSTSATVSTPMTSRCGCVSRRTRAWPSRHSTLR